MSWTFILLGYERGEKYHKYKLDVDANVYWTRNCECSFRLKGKPSSLTILKFVEGHDGSPISVKGF